MNSWMHKIALFFYFIFWRLALGLIRLLGSRAPIKIQNYLKEREYPQLIWRRIPQPNSRRIWFHASSGEIEYIKPIIKLWKLKYPEDSIVLTYFSTSARSMIKGVVEIDAYAPLPFDLPPFVSAFNQALKPSILIISRTDLWPYLLSSLSRIPKILVASTWSEGNQKTQGLGRLISQWCLPSLQKVCVVSAKDAEWLQTFSPQTSLAITGDPRFDQVQTRLKAHRPMPSLLEHWKSNQFLFIAGSTWPEDEKVLIPAIQKLLNLKMRFLIVPHETHAESMEKLQHELRKAKIEFCLWSQIEQSKTTALNAPLLIFDQKGWLAELYRLADLAFIGGSFKKQVHSVMEALGCGLPVVVGPLYKNNREAIEFSQLQFAGIPFVSAVNNPQDMVTMIHQHQSLDLSKRANLKSQILKEFTQHCGGSEKTMIEIESLLK